VSGDKRPAPGFFDTKNFLQAVSGVWFFGAKLHPSDEIVNRGKHSQQPLFLTRHNGCDQTVVSIFMSRVRHCVECPKCRTRYLPSFSPYRNGSYLIPLTAHGASGWILYCSCRMPPASSQWGSTDLKRYEICGQAYRRGYGSPDEVWDVTRHSGVDSN
jgi:hypothetical protein